MMLAVESGINQADYFAFTAAYGMLMGAFMALSGIALSAAQIQPVLKMAKPFLETVPETASDREIVTKISGRVELEHVSFRYDESTPEEREFLNFRYVLELKDKEIATLLSQNEKTVNKHYQRLLQKCREYL